MDYGEYRTAARNYVPHIVRFDYATHDQLRQGRLDMPNFEKNYSRPGPSRIEKSQIAGARLVKSMIYNEFNKYKMTKTVCGMQGIYPFPIRQEILNLM